jgi:hypothetical protein
MAKVSYNSLKDLPYIIVEDVLNFVTSEPATPTAGQIYYSTTAGTSSVTATVVSANTYLEWMGASWNEKAVRDGATVYAKDEDKRYDYNGTLLSEATASSLRGEPVANNAALTALVAKDYEQRKVVSDGKEYVFTLGAVLGTLPDDGATGYWKEVVPTSEAVKKSITQTAHGFTEIGTPVYITSAGLYVKADNDTDITSDAIGLVEAIANVNSFTLTQSGYISGITPAVISSGVPTVGSAGFVDSVAGKITTTAPTLSTQFRKPVIIFDSATSGWVIDRTGTSAGTAAVATNIPNSPSSTLAPVAIADKPTGGNIGTAATTVDVNSAFVVTQTTASQTITLPAPTAPTGSRVVTVQNATTSTTSFTIYNSILAIGQSIDLFWNGAAWSIVGSEAQALAYMSINNSTDGVTNLGSFVNGVVTYTGTAQIDTANALNEATGSYTVPASGLYYVSGNLSIQNQSTQGDDTFTVEIRVDGVAVAKQVVNPMSYAGDNEEGQVYVDATISATTGQVITLAVINIDDVQNITSKSFTINQLPTSVAPVVNTIAENGSLNLTSNVAIAGGNTSAATGVTVLTFTLPTDGTWDVTSVVKGQIPVGANSNIISGIFDSSNTLVPGSDVIIGMATTTAGIQDTGTANVIIYTTASATYTIKAWNTFGFGGSVNATPNGTTGVRWKKIAGGIPSTGQTVDFVNIVATTNQTTGITVGSPILFNTPVTKGNIPQASGVFTLQANKTYSLQGGVGLLTTGTEIIYQWKDITNNTLIGAAGNAHITAAGRNVIATANITTTDTTTVRLEITGLNGVTDIGTGLSRQSFATITQIGSTSNTVGTLPALDQSSTGYFDIGNMRMQWGTGTTNGISNVTLPAAFANTNYRVTSSYLGSGSIAANPTGTKTTATFQVNSFFAPDGGPSGSVSFDWFAVGQKP